MVTFRDTKEMKKLLKLFADYTGCSIQYNKCPCNSCFHNIKADFQHICWLILLGLRGDYNSKRIIRLIENELKEVKHGKMQKL